MLIKHTVILCDLKFKMTFQIVFTNPQNDKKKRIIEVETGQVLLGHLVRIYSSYIYNI